MSEATPTKGAPSQLDARVADLSYEEARGRLVEIVTRLEQGAIPLEESIELWELGEALARRCQAWLDGARESLATAQNREPGGQAAAGTADLTEEGEES